MSERSEAKTHEIDGKKYVEVERKAEVGEKVIVVKNDEIMGEDHVGEIATVTEIGGGLVYTTGKWDDGSELNLDEEEYRVLEEAPDLVDLIANLSAEVTQLKRNHAEQLDTLFRNVQHLGEELATLQTAEPVDNTPVTLPKWIVDRLMGGYRG